MACFWILICRSWLCVLNVTYCLVAACYEPTYGVSRSEIRSFLRCRYRRWFYFSRKNSPRPSICTRRYRYRYPLHGICTVMLPVLRIAPSAPIHADPEARCLLKETTLPILASWMSFRTYLIVDCFCSLCTYELVNGIILNFICRGKLLAKER
jgi:hypothetical protein